MRRRRGKLVLFTLANLAWTYKDGNFGNIVLELSSMTVISLINAGK